MQTIADVPDTLDVRFFARALGPRYRCYVGGLRELLDLFALAYPDDYSREGLYAVIAGYHELAVAKIPAELRRRPFHDTRLFHWDYIKPQDVISACECKLIRYDRAIQVANCLTLALRWSSAPGLSTVDAWRFLRVRPVIFTFEGGGARWLDHGSGPIYERMLNELGAGRPDLSERKVKSFLKNVGSGGAITHANAVRLRAYLTEAKIPHSGFGVVTNRAEPKPVKEEACFISLAPALAAEFSLLRTACAQAQARA
ncbi:hypothetical protein ASD45_20960 [Pseudolabrys sp. Root1462]|nr:hypothetical protein ASD45_20960 [Pseudolabrys sp. Root1462]